MLVSDMMSPEGRVFMKSEFGPIGDDWPCFSFTKKSVGQRLRAEFRPGRDIIIYVGTTNPETTEDPNHRSRLISAVSVEPNQILDTSKIVPEKMWEWSVSTWGEKWAYSLAVIDAALMIGPPFADARSVAPKAYASFAEIQNRGNFVEALDEERIAIMALDVERIALTFTTPVQRYLHLMLSTRVPDKTIRQEANRMAANILERVAKGGETSSRLNPVRTAPNISDLIALITRKWLDDQKGRCALCGGILAQTKSKMLQPSADRIDSMNISYDAANMQITHLACNLAKNKWGASDFEEWLTVIKGADLDRGLGTGENTGYVPRIDEVTPSARPTLYSGEE